MRDGQVKVNRERKKAIDKNKGGKTFSPFGKNWKSVKIEDLIWD